MKLRGNDPCPCGSGATYAKCHAQTLAPARQPADPRPVLVREGFLDVSTCRLMVEGFERNTAHLERRPADPYWSERLLYYQALAHEPEMQRAMREAREAVVREIRAFYGVAEALYSDTVHLVRWREGQSMMAHADNAQLDGRPNEYPWRAYANVLYLNDDFEGGEIYFERTKLRIRPRAGMLVAFGGSLEHVHGVTEVRRGTRYTMPAWHTFDAGRRDRSFD